MEAKDLYYDSLLKEIGSHLVEGRTESAAFLRWFLENIFRLDETDADDAICDSSNDRGIDGIVVNDFNDQILVFQAKIAQNEKKTLGDTALKEFEGTLKQLSTAESVGELINGESNTRLKQLLKRLNIPTLITDGYTVTGCFVTNQIADNNAVAYTENHSDIEVYDRERIAQEHVDLDADEGIQEEAEIPAFENQVIRYKAGDQATLYQIISKASDLINLGGIEDQTLFSQNVRLSLGNTKVNKDISASISDQSRHKRFPLFHNGITLLADKIVETDNGIRVKNYVVVNGAQSLSTLYANRESLSDELRISVRAVELKNKPELAKEITHNSNNQNAIKARDLKANNSMQQRLQAEFRSEFNGYYGFSIKRGEPLDDKIVIGNEDAAALMLAMDLQRPWTCHQRYKFFDEFYSDIFGRPEVDAFRIVFLFELGEHVRSRMTDIIYEPIARYKLSYYFILYCLSSIMRLDKESEEIFRNPSALFDHDDFVDKLCNIIDPIISDVITDFNYEIKRMGDDFDYKAELKSPKRVAALADDLIKEYEKQVKKGKADSFATLWEKALEEAS